MEFETQTASMIRTPWLFLKPAARPQIRFGAENIFRAIPAWTALTGQFHRDRRKATCVEDAIVGPELNSAEGGKDPEGKRSDLHGLSCSIASCRGRGFVLFQYCTVGTPLDPICGLFPSIQEQSLITATPPTQGCRTSEQRRFARLSAMWMATVWPKWCSPEHAAVRV